MQVKKEQLFTMAASLGIVKAALKKTLPDYKPEICDTIVYNSLTKAIEKKSTSNKEA